MLVRERPASLENPQEYPEKNLEQAAPVGSPSGLIGRSVERGEDGPLLTGRGSFADDAAIKPSTLSAAVLRSPHAHARIRSIDVQRTLAFPGVRCVLTGEDVKRWSAPFTVGVKQPMEHFCLAVGRVRYSGEPVAIVVAEDRYLAEDALDAIEVEYETLPAVVDTEAALAPSAPVLHEAVGSNVVSDRHFRYGDPEAQFARADRIVEIKVQYPRNSVTPIECYVVVAEYEPTEDAYDVFSHFQGPFAMHPVMALALKVPGARLRLRTARDSGGSFGVKQSVFPYIVAMCLASRKAGAPVKWVEDRLEHLTAATSATNRVAVVRAAVKSDGEVIALDYDQLDDCGAYLKAPEPATFYRMHGVLTGAYAIRHLAVRNRVVLTNKTPSGLVRGFGGPQMYFALERLMQRVAAELGLDPFAVIKRNLVPAGSFPYRCPAGALLDSGDYPAVVALAEREGNLAGLRARRDAMRREGRLYGIGCAAVVEPSVSNMGYITAVLTPEERAKAGPKNGAIASATVNVDPLGSVSVMFASVPQGQGHKTVAQQIVAEALGLELADVTVNTELDTQKDAWSIAAGNYSSRFAAAVAGALHLAAMKIRARLSDLAAVQLGCAPGDVRFAMRKVFAANAPEKTLAFARLAGNTHWAPLSLPEQTPLALRETVFWSPATLDAPDETDVINSSAAYGFIFDFCGVAVDRVTGEVRIDRYVTAHDAGRILHPAMADGQIRGGFANAIGAALYEEFTYGDDGSFRSGTFADYLVPTACEVPEPQILHYETPSPFTPLGAKGLGEGNCMSTPVCLANAVADALAALPSAAAIRLPMSPSSIRALLDGDAPEPPPTGGSEVSAMPGSGGSALRAPQSSDGPRLRAPQSSDGPWLRTQGSSGGSRLRAQGSIVLPASPADVFAVLLDPAALARVIPGCHSLEPIGANHYRADVTLGVGLVTARYAAEVKLADIDPPHGLTLSGKGISALGSAGGEGRVTLAAEGSGTRLSYDYSAAVGGKVAAVGSRMLEGAAKIVLAQLFERLGRQASGDSTPTERPRSWWRRLFARFGIRR